MLGAIIGDIVGSVYEWDNIKTKEFPLFKPDCFFTDDTVMSVAVAEGLIKGGSSEDYIGAMKEFGRLYPDAGYGGRFYDWLFSDNTEPYNSWGNGSAMRVSPVAWSFETLEEVEEAATTCTAVTHNHPEGIRGARATAACIFWGRQGMPKSAIRQACRERYGYNLQQTPWQQSPAALPKPTMASPTKSAGRPYPILMKSSLESGTIGWSFAPKNVTNKLCPHVACLQVGKRPQVSKIPSCVR